MKVGNMSQYCRRRIPKSLCGLLAIPLLLTSETHASPDRDAVSKLLKETNVVSEKVDFALLASDLEEIYRRDPEYFDNLTYLEEANTLNNLSAYTLVNDNWEAFEHLQKRVFSNIRAATIEHRRLLRIAASEKRQERRNEEGLLMIASAILNAIIRSELDLPEFEVDLTMILPSDDYIEMPSLQDKFFQAEGDIKRFPVNPVAQPFSSIVKVYGSGTCTGFFVDRDLVATNAHCLDGVRSVKSEHLFHENEYRVTSFVTSAGKNQIPNYDADRSLDWAILEVESEASFFPLSLSSSHKPSDRPDYMIAGYSSDLGNGRFLTLDLGCSIEKDTSTIFEYDCKTHKGSSGAPVIDIDSGRVVGINAYRYNLSGDCETVKCSAGGPRIRALASKLRELKRERKAQQFGG